MNKEERLFEGLGLAASLGGQISRLLLTCPRQRGMIITMSMDDIGEPND